MKTSTLGLLLLGLGAASACGSYGAPPANTLPPMPTLATDPVDQPCDAPTEPAPAMVHAPVPGTLVTDPIPTPESAHAKVHAPMPGALVTDPAQTPEPKKTAGTRLRGVVEAVMAADALKKALPPQKPHLLGAAKDAHGCVTTAGYIWSEAKGRCVRPWEEVEEAPPAAGFCVGVPGCERHSKKTNCAAGRNCEWRTASEDSNDDNNGDNDGEGTPEMVRVEPELRPMDTDVMIQGYVPPPDMKEMPVGEQQQQQQQQPPQAPDMQEEMQQQQQQQTPDMKDQQQQQTPDMQEEMQQQQQPQEQAPDMQEMPVGEQEQQQQQSGAPAFPVSLRTHARMEALRREKNVQRKWKRAVSLAKEMYAMHADQKHHRRQWKAVMAELVSTVKRVKPAAESQGTMADAEVPPPANWADDENDGRVYADADGAPEAPRLRTGAQALRRERLRQQWKHVVSRVKKGMEPETGAGDTRADHQQWKEAVSELVRFVEARERAAEAGADERGDDVAGHDDPQQEDSSTTSDDCRKACNGAPGCLCSDDADAAAGFFGLLLQFLAIFFAVSCCISCARAVRRRRLAAKARRDGVVINAVVVPCSKDLEAPVMT